MQNLRQINAARKLGATAAKSKRDIVETFDEGFAATEFKVGEGVVYVAARRLHRTANGTVVWEGLDRQGRAHKGTKSQIRKLCDPYSRKADATGRANKGAVN